MTALSSCSSRLQRLISPNLAGSRSSSCVLGGVLVRPFGSAAAQRRRQQKSPASPNPASRRQQLKQLPVNANLLQQIYDQNLCKRPMKQSTVRRRQRQNTEHDLPTKPGLPNKPPPLPFGPDANPVRKRGQIQATDSVEQALQTINPQRIPTVALCGRSNVGKSTLMNALLYGSRTVEIGRKDKNGNTVGGRRNMRNTPRVALPRGVKAIMSAKPGETKEITFYELSSRAMASKGTATNNDTSGDQVNDDKRFHQSSQQRDQSHPLKLWLADLPGYGFAHASDETVQNYQQLMATYLTQTAHPPRRLLLLLDARHGLKQTDRAFLQALQERPLDESTKQRRRQHILPPLQIVLTKCDLVDAVDLARRVTQVQDEVSDVLRRQQSSRLPVLLTSATRHNGILAVQKELVGLVRR